MFFFVAKFYRYASFEPRSQAWWLHWKVVFWHWCHRLWKPFGSHDLQPLDVSWLEMEKTCHGGTKQRDVLLAIREPLPAICNRFNIDPKMS